MDLSIFFGNILVAPLGPQFDFTLISPLTGACTAAAVVAAAFFEDDVTFAAALAEVVETLAEVAVVVT